MWFFKPWDLLDLRFFGCETFGSLIGFVSKVFLGLSFFGLVLECDRSYWILVTTDKL